MIKHVETTLKETANSRPFFLFSFLVALFSFLPFVYLDAIQYVFVDNGESWLSGVVSVISIPIGIVAFGISVSFLGSVLGYAASFFIFILSMLFSLIKEKHNRKTLGILSLLSVSALVFVLLPYRPALAAADNYDMILLTEPSPILRGLKRVQAIGEYHPCTYDLLGWESETLYYRSTCKHENQQVWQFNPATGPVPVGYAPQHLDTETLPRDSALEYLQAKYAFPPSAEHSIRDLQLKDPILISPNGKWMTIVCQHVYSLEDVLTVQIEK